MVTELGIPRQMVHLVSSTDSDVREAALGGLLELAKDKKSGTTLADEEKLKSVLQSRIDYISEMSQDQLEAAREERQLVDSLWKECYNEPSSLREKGLVVLPGEDTFKQPPDVAGKYFEPALRAWSGPRQDGNNDGASAGEKKDAPPPLLLGPGPSSSQSNGS
jgi:hsp70-interacting protein